MAELTQHNNSITTGDFGFSGAVVTAICGKPLGGTGGTIIGQTYTADNIDIELRTGNVFGLTTTFKNSIPSKVTNLTDSANYATTALLDSVSSELKDTFSDYYTKTQVDTTFASASQLSSYLTTVQYETDSATFLTQQDISGLATKNELVTASGEIESWVTDQHYLQAVPDTYYTKTETSGKDELSAAFAKYTKTEDLHIPTTVAELTDSSNYYKITETSGKDELSDAFNNIMKYNVTAQQGCEVQSAVDNGITTFGISITATPVVTDTSLSGYSGIAAAKDGNVSGRWNIGLTQDMINAINSKLNSDIAAQTYQTKGDYAINADLQYVSAGVDYVSGHLPDISDMATQTWVSGQGYLTGIPSEYVTTATTNSLSSQIEEISSTLNDKYTLSAGTGIYFYEDAINKTTRIDCTVTAATTVAQLTDSANYYKKDETSGANEISAALNDKADASALNNYLTTAQYETDSATFVTSLSDYIPYSALNLPIGSNNTAINNAIAIGSNNTANNLGFAVGQSNTALKRSLAFGVNNYANDISLAIGYGNHASGNNNNNQSAVNIAIGYANSAADHAAAFINVCTAENYAFAAGHGNLAIDNSVAFGRDSTAKFYSFDFGNYNNVKNYSYAFGRGLHYEGQWANGAQYGAFVIGGWNATTSYATTADAPLFIIGNGTNHNPSDGFIVYRDGNVSAKQYKAEGYTQNNTYVEASVPKSLPNSGDNAMVVQKMFVCTSDPDIIAHAGLANGEGCIFFRVG